MGDKTPRNIILALETPILPASTFHNAHGAYFP